MLERIPDGSEPVLDLPRELNHLARRIKHGLKWLVAPVSVRIRGGPLAGLRWSAATGSRFVTGTYEPFKTRALIDVLEPGGVMLDVGAHVGYYAAVAAKRVGPTGMVIAFEPRPLNLRFLRKHVRDNKLDNVRIVAAGVSDRRGSSAFDTRTGTGTGHFAEDGDLVVPSVRLDDLYRDGEIPRVDLLKIDVEGGEVNVLQGALGLIRAERPALLVATHGDSLHRDVLLLLEELGYRHRVLDAGGSSGDVEVLATPREVTTAKDGNDPTSSPESP